MAPPRRVRGEVLSLRKPGRSDIELMRSRETSYGEAFPSQRRFLVSPDARMLAYTSPGKQLLTLMRRDGASLVITGVENQEIRFSPDAKTFAAVRWVENKRRVERVDLTKLTIEPWADLSSVFWMEFSGDGLVVLHAEEGSSDRCFTLLPWSGEPRLLGRTNAWVSRFVAAKATSRVAYFSGYDIVSIDGLGGAPETIAVTNTFVTNAEMSPDGRTIVLTGGQGTFRVEGDGPLERLDANPSHTIWFARDGQSFVWANPSGVVWQKGSERRVLASEPNATINAARYLPASPGLIVSRGRDLLRWNPERSEVEVLASAEPSREMLGADVFGGGLVLWIGTPWTHERFAELF
jgi:hypothetical protein